MTQANRVELQMMAPVLDVSTTGLKFTTANAFANRLGVLQAITYKRAELRAQNVSDASVTVEVFAGADSLGAVTMSANGAGVVDVDLAGISGAALITAKITVGTAGTGTGQVFARLDIEQPLQVGRC
jgi:hypothetical protein